MARLRLILLLAVVTVVAVGAPALPAAGQAPQPASVSGPAAAVEAVAAPNRVADELAVLEVVRRLFEGMRTRDEALLRSVWHPAARLQTVAPAPDGQGSVVRETAIDDFVASVLGGAVELDEVTFDEEVRIDGDLATAWTPYNLFVDGTFSHCGIDAFQLVRTAGGWQIHQLTDTRRRTGCDPERRGD